MRLLPAYSILAFVALSAAASEPLTGTDDDSWFVRDGVLISLARPAIAIDPSELEAAHSQIHRAAVIHVDAHGVMEATLLRGEHQAPTTGPG